MELGPPVGIPTGPEHQSVGKHLAKEAGHTMKTMKGMTVIVVAPVGAAVGCDR